MTELSSSFSYSPILVVLSVVVAIQAGYVGLSLALLIPGAFANRRRLLIAGSAVTLAVGIWSMHFIGMLAITASVAIDYAIVPTLLSFLICGLVTGVAIYLASLRSQRLLVVAAVLMGMGITTMHYVGMTAVHSVFHLTHDPAYALASIAIAIAASGLALWLAFSADRRPPLFLCAVVLGCAVSGMHYMAMAGTTLDLATTELSDTKSLISGDILAAIVSVLACSISAVFMLALIPAEKKDVRSDTAWRAADTFPGAHPDGSSPGTRPGQSSLPLVKEGLVQPPAEPGETPAVAASRVRFWQQKTCFCRLKGTASDFILQRKISCRFIPMRITPISSTGETTSSVRCRSPTLQRACPRACFRESIAVISSISVCCPPQEGWRCRRG